MSKVEQFVGRQFDQIAFVVPDLAKARDNFSRMFGISNWNTWTDLANGQKDKFYYEDPGDFQFSCAYGYVGDIQVELCRHDGGRSIYKDWLDKQGGGFHHTGFRLDTREEYEAAAAWLVDQGAPRAMGGEIEGLGIWAYFDTVDELGCFTELYWSAPAVLEIFEKMKRGEQVSLT